jgi:hypothetical protein
MFFPESQSSVQTIKKGSVVWLLAADRHPRVTPTAAIVASGAPAAKHNSSGLTSSQCQYDR